MRVMASDGAETTGSDHDARGLLLHGKVWVRGAEAALSVAKSGTIKVLFHSLLFLLPLPLLQTSDRSVGKNPVTFLNGDFLSFSLSYFSSLSKWVRWCLCRSLPPSAALLNSEISISCFSRGTDRPTDQGTKARVSSLDM